MATRAPPRYVPTLTEIVQASGSQGPGASHLTPEDQMVQRVMQRIEMSLERRLRETVATTVIEQTRMLLPALRAEIEGVVRNTVADAFAQELEPPAQRP